MGGCLLAVRFPLANPTNPNTTTKNPPPTTNHKPQTDSHQPLCIKCGLPSCRALVCWWVCGGCVVGGWLVVACFNLTHQTRTRPPATNTHHKPQPPTTPTNHIVSMWGLVWWWWWVADGCWLSGRLGAGWPRGLGSQGGGGLEGWGGGWPAQPSPPRKSPWEKKKKKTASLKKNAIFREAYPKKWLNILVFLGMPREISMFFRNSLFSFFPGRKKKENEHL